MRSGSNCMAISSAINIATPEKKRAGDAAEYIAVENLHPCLPGTVYPYFYRSAPATWIPTGIAPRDGVIGGFS